MCKLRAIRVSPNGLALRVACALVLSTGTALALPAFDSGTSVAFNAEDNALVSYTANPAKLVYYARSAVLLDVGGDWSVGSIKYSEGGGKGEPGTPPEPGEAAAELTFNVAAAASGLGVLRSGSTVAAFGGGVDWTTFSVGLSGVSVPEVGYWEGDAYTFSVPSERAEAVVAFDLGSWAFGASGRFSYTDATSDEKWYEYGRWEPESGWSFDELTLTNVEFLGGAFYRSEDTHLGFAGGLQVLRNSLDLLYSETWYWYWYPRHDGFKASATRFLGQADYRTMPWSKVAVGLKFDFKVAPVVAIDEHDVDYRVGEGLEYDLAFRPGFALYPDEKTTVAFDYNVNLVHLGYDELDHMGRIFNEYSFDDLATSTQVGLERWFTDDVSFKAGWRQNVLAVPRNTMFAGACYRPNENWTFNYDFAEGYVTVNDPSAFLSLGDLVHPGSHRITLTRNF